MHIMEGFLPLKHAAGWTLASAPFVGYGFYTINKKIKQEPEHRMLLGVSAAFTFALSALKLPSVTGSSSHPTGTGLGAVIFGPFAMAAIGMVVLLFQALLLAHGGLTTLGANTFSMAVVGPFAAYIIYRSGCRLKLPLGVSVFLAAALADLLTYITTSMQLALAFPDPAGGFWASFAKFAGIFAFTQIPLAVAEGLMTVVSMNVIARFNARELKELNVLEKAEAEV